MTLPQPRPGHPTDADWAEFRRIRTECRAGCGGGMCHEVSEAIEFSHGWERVAGSYCRDGEVCIAGHYWNVLPDGSILDCTADQTGEGHDMRLIPPGHPDHSRYDEEWHPDWNPTTPDYRRYVHAGGRDPATYAGEDDLAQQDRLRRERGEDWWATDPTQLRAYLDEDLRQACDFYRPFVLERLAALDARTAPAIAA